VHVGSRDRVDSQAPLIHAGAFRRSESAPFLELFLVDFAARKALLENVVARMWRRVPWLRYHTRLLRELSAQPATCLAIPMSAVNMPCAELSHRTPGYATVQGRAVGGSGCPKRIRANSIDQCEGLGSRGHAAVRSNSAM
jgi:hypothetical protein